MENGVLGKLVAYFILLMIILVGSIVGLSYMNKSLEPASLEQQEEIIVQEVQQI